MCLLNEHLWRVPHANEEDIDEKISRTTALKIPNQAHPPTNRSSVGISPATVSNYSQAAQKAGLSWPLPTSLSDEELIARIEPVAKQLRHQSSSKVMPCWPEIAKALTTKHMTLRLLWEDYAAAHGKKAYSYTHFTRGYKAWSKRQKVSLRLTHKAGEKAFIDYAGTTIAVLNHDGTVAFHAHLFVMALGLSHYTFAHACRSQQLPDWLDAHVRALDYFDGVPTVWVPDNLKSGITNSCQFEPEANLSYAALAEHYGAAIIPARPARPQDKSIAENAVLVASRWIIARLAKQRFYSLQALNNAIADLLTALNNKPFQKREGSRRQQYEALEKAALNPMPKTRYEYAKLAYQRVAKDYHIRIDKHYYSVPYTLVGETLLCRLTATTVEFLYQNQRVASHLRSDKPDAKTTCTSHMPKHHQDYHAWSPQTFMDWAEQTGTAVLQVAQHILATKKHPEQCSKIHAGLKRLAKNVGIKRLNHACRRALACHCISFRSIESILNAGLDKQPYLQMVTANDNTEHTNLRGAAYYQSSS